MSLANKVTTLGGMLSRADKTGPSYQFHDVNNRKDDPRVVSIPISLDQKKATLRQLINHKVTIEADMAGMASELISIDREITKHQIEFSKEMIDLNIPAPMANDTIPTTPPAVPQDVE